MKRDLGLVITFILLGIVSRTILHIIPNLEFVTALSITAGYFVKNRYLAFLVPVGIMIFSDLIIGNTIILLFTWTAFIFPVLIGKGIKYIKLSERLKNYKILRMGILGIFAGFSSTLFFFLWTNLGVVLVSGMYDKNILGLLESYINALPFLRPQMVGNLLLVPTILILSELVLNRKVLISLKEKLGFVS